MVVTAASLSHAEDLADFVAASPSSYHAAAEVSRRLEEAGFTRLHEEDHWPAQPGGRFVVVRDGAVIAWVVPADAAPTTPAQIFGAHTDSPGFKLKPKPTTGSRGWLQAGVEVYGGPLLNSWLDRELRLAGRLALADGRVVLADTGALLRLPQLAVHLDREANTGLALDKQFQTQPVWGLGDPLEEDLLGELAASAGVDAADVRGFDAVVADAARGAVFGKDDAFFASGRLDDLASVHAGAAALTALSEEPEQHRRTGRVRSRRARLRLAVGRRRPLPRRHSGARLRRRSERMPRSSAVRSRHPGICRATSGTRCIRTTRTSTTPSSSRCSGPARS